MVRKFFETGDFFEKFNFSYILPALILCFVQYFVILFCCFWAVSFSSTQGSKKNSTQLVTSTFKSAWEERVPELELLFHSDRGAQYTSHRFQELLRRHSIVQSFSNSGKPHDNAVAESFFASLKKEELYRKDYASEPDFKRSISAYIEFYNMKRPHRTLKNRTPCQMEEDYQEVMSQSHGK